jgi:hypothetical protein
MERYEDDTGDDEPLTAEDKVRIDREFDEVIDERLRIAERHWMPERFAPPLGPEGRKVLEAWARGMLGPEKMREVQRLVRDYSSWYRAAVFVLFDERRNGGRARKGLAKLERENRREKG